MDINSLTIGEAKELAAMFGGSHGQTNDFAEWVGKKVFIRTVTHHYTGLVKRLVGATSCILEDAAWIADSGRFSAALKSCDFDEVEPYHGPVQISYGAVLDISEIGSLPRVVK